MGDFDLATVGVLQAGAGEASRFLKKLSNPDRLMIVCALVAGEQSVTHLEELLAIRQPRLSQHLAELRDGGFIVGRREGKAMHYKLADGRVYDFVALMHQLFCSPAKPRRKRSSASSGRQR